MICRGTVYQKSVPLGAVVSQVLLLRCHLQISFNVLIWECWQHTVEFKSIQYAFAVTNLFLIWSRHVAYVPLSCFCLEFALLHVYFSCFCQTYNPPTEIRLKPTCQTQQQWVARLEHSMLGWSDTYSMLLCDSWEGSKSDVGCIVNGAFLYIHTLICFYDSR